MSTFSISAFVYPRNRRKSTISYVYVTAYLLLDYPVYIFEIILKKYELYPVKFLSEIFSRGFKYVIQNLSLFKQVLYFKKYLHCNLFCNNYKWI